MSIEKIVCPILNKNPRSEVFIKFDVAEEPRAIMCQMYDKSTGYCTLRENSSCTYSEWSEFKK